MMSAHISSPDKSERFDRRVKKLRSVCEMHGVSFGSPGDLPFFMERLAEDKHFAMDFWAFIGSLSSGDGGEICNEEMLAVIVDGIAGSEVPEGNSRFRKSLGELTRMVSGMDIHRAAGQDDVETTPLPTREAGWTGVHEEMPRGAAGEVAQGPTARHASVYEAIDREASKSASWPPALPQELSDALLRLELSSLELKQYLDKIDDRMRRLEQLGDLSSLSPASREDVRPQTEAPSSRTDADLVHKSDVNGNGSSRLVLAPDVLPDTGRISEEREDSSEEAQTEDDAQIGWDWNIIGLGILVLMVAGAFAWQRYSTLLEGKFSSLMQEMHVVKATPNAESSIDKGTVSEGAAAVPASGGSSSSAPQQGVRAIYGGSQVAGSGTDFREREKMATDLPAATTAGTTAADDGSGAAGLVNVAPDLMESHLILSRVPTYPEAAKEAQVEGAVEAEVIISKSGTVKRVHVIDGDPLLRGAAAEAIQKYRYQPYLINGRPFEVATTVTVNFIMNQ